MLCAIGQDLAEELRASGLELSTAEAERDRAAAETARNRRQKALFALEEHRETCHLCSKSGKKKGLSELQN
jgi:hypothetical protein